jgi:hypothetical protein
MNANLSASDPIHQPVREPLPLTEAEVWDLATDWYHKLDIHAPLTELTPLLVEEGLRMVFPEMTAEGLEGIRQWYERVINLFFDEVHTVKEVKLTPKANWAEVKVMVKWEASRWMPPAPHSERIMLDAYQTWEVVRSPVSQKPVIQTYIVDALDYYPGSARL